MVAVSPTSCSQARRGRTDQGLGAKAHYVPHNSSPLKIEVICPASDQPVGRFHGTDRPTWRLVTKFLIRPRSPWGNAKLREYSAGARHKFSLVPKGKGMCCRLGDGEIRGSKSSVFSPGGDADGQPDYRSTEQRITSMEAASPSAPTIRFPPENCAITASE